MIGFLLAESDNDKDDVENIIFVFILWNTAVTVKSLIFMAHIICHAYIGLPATRLELDIFCNIWFVLLRISLEVHIIRTI